MLNPLQKRMLGARQQQLRILNPSRTLGAACAALGVGSLLATGSEAKGEA